MNQRIRSLLAKAHLDVMEDLGNLNTSQVGERFAELLIKECMTLCEDVAERNDPAIACYYEIKKHFGIER